MSVEQVGGEHYKKKIQHWDYACQLPYLDGQISKYIDRHQEKGGFEDLLKSLSYLEKAMQYYYPEAYAQFLSEHALKGLAKPFESNLQPPEPPAEWGIKKGGA